MQKTQNTLIIKVNKKLEIYISNFIDSYDNFEQLSDLPLLELRLLYNPIALKRFYYKQIYDLIPSLYTLDDHDRDGL